MLDYKHRLGNCDQCALARHYFSLFFSVLTTETVGIFVFPEFILQYA